MEEEKAYEYWLCRVEGLGPAKLSRIYAACPGARDCFLMEKSSLQRIYGLEEKDVINILESRKKADPVAEYEALLKSGVSMIGMEDPEYPEGLKMIKDPPWCLFVRGKLPTERRPRVAVVGARECSDYGRAMAKTIGRVLAENGVQVISGMARGIDSYAHEGALMSGGDTYAVLGCGVDICYPASSRKLYEEIPKMGGVLSEFSPDEEPRPALFPVRNRIISGISDAVIVVEARKRSGSLITADLALSQGKDIYALPGRITDSLSSGTNRLISQGATPIVSMEDLLKNLKLAFAPFYKEEKKAEPALPEKEAAVYGKLTESAKKLEELLKETGLKIPELTESLLRLTAAGLCEESFKNCYRRKN